jgi:hypothetical protein
MRSQTPADARSVSLSRQGSPSAMQASPVGQQVSDYTGAAALMNDLPEPEWLLADRGYDADWFREALTGALSPAVLGESLARKPSSMTRDATSDAPVSRGCLGGSRTGGGSQHAMTDHQPSSWRQSRSLQPSYSGYEFRVA